MSVKLDNRTLAALKILAGEMTAETGRAVSLNETVWNLIEKCAKETADRVNQLSNQGGVGQS
jgi:hypothetical protein